MNSFVTEIQKILKAHLPDKVGIFLYGSRATGGAREFSDFDIGLYAGEEIGHTTIRKLKNSFKESNIPFNIDIVDFYGAKLEFQRLATKDIEIWQNPSLIQSWIKNLKN